MKIFDESCFKYDDMTDEQKQIFLQKEADNISAILQVEKLHVVISDDILDFEVKDVCREIIFNPGLKVLDAVSIVANVGRQLWCHNQGLGPSMADCMCFAAGYLMYEHKSSWDELQVEIAGNPEASKYINALIITEWIGTRICGNGPNAKLNWIERMRHTFINDKGENEYDRKE